MHYVKQFNINGVDTKQVACIELQGVPNAATEGAVGVLGMNMASPTHDVYRCVAVNGSVYTWELLSAGMSIMSATISGEGALSVSFLYSNLVVPNNYIIKVGDLILDKEGYLYQITSIGSSSCDARYCDTRIGGVANGDNDRRLTVKDGKLKLVTEGGNVLSEVDYEFADDDTIYRNPSTGKICAIGIKTINGTPLRFFVGEQSEYDALTDIQKTNLFAIITDDKIKEKLLGDIDILMAAKEEMAEAIVTIIDDTRKLINGLRDGSFVVGKATNDGNGNNIPDTYARKDALSNGSLVVGKATNDGNGNNISTTYRKINDAVVDTTVNGLVFGIGSSGYEAIDLSIGNSVPNVGSLIEISGQVEVTDSANSGTAFTLTMAFRTLACTQDVGTGKVFIGFAVPTTAEDYPSMLNFQIVVNAVNNTIRFTPLTSLQNQITQINLTQLTLHFK